MNHDGYIHASDDKVLNVIVIVDRSQHYAHDRWNYQNLQISDILTETHFFGAVFVSYSHWLSHKADTDVFCSRKLLIFVHSFLIGHFLLNIYFTKHTSYIFLNLREQT